MKTVADLDHAYELSLVLTSIFSGILVQFVSDKPVELPPIIGNLQKFSVVFVLPTIIMIFAWILIYFTDNKVRKMQLRTYSWALLILTATLELIELYVVVVRLPEGPTWLAYSVLIPLGFSFIFPVIPFLLLRSILKRYKMELGPTYPKSRNRLTMAIKDYVPVVIAWVVVILSFLLTLSI